jgi:hypothetical protein
LLLEKNLGSFLGRVCWCQARYSRGVIPLKIFWTRLREIAGGREVLRVDSHPLFPPLENVILYVETTAFSRGGCPFFMLSTDTRTTTSRRLFHKSRANFLIINQSSAPPHQGAVGYPWMSKMGTVRPWGWAVPGPHVFLFIDVLHSHVIR